MVRILKVSLAIVLLGSAAPLLLSSAFAKETFSVLSNFNIAEGGNSTSSLIADADGNSRISAEDYAIAFVDELEQGRFIRQIATVAY